MTTLDIFLDTRGPHAITHTVSEHKLNSFHQAHRLVVAGNTQASFPVIRYLTESAIEKIPILLGLPTSSDDPLAFDMTALARRLPPEVQDDIAACEAVKDGETVVTQF